MKCFRLFNYVVVAVFMLGVTFCVKADELATNKSVSDLPIVMVDGKTTTLGKIQNNKPIYIKFWASWCATCLKEMPKLVQDFKKYGDKIQFLTVNVGVEDTPEDIKRIYEQFGLEMPSAIDLDSGLAQAFGFVGTPYHLLFTSDWTLVHKGHSADDQLNSAFALLAGGGAENNSIQKKELIGTSATSFPQMLLPKNGIVFYTIAWCDWYMQEANKPLAERCKKVSENIAKLKIEKPELNISILVSPMWMSEEEITGYQKRFAIDMPVYVDAGDKLSRQFGLRNVGMVLVFKDGRLNEKITGVEDYSRITNIAF